MLVDSSARGQSVTCPTCSSVVTVPLHFASSPPNEEGSTRKTEQSTAARRMWPWTAVTVLGVLGVAVWIIAQKRSGAPANPASPIPLETSSAPAQMERAPESTTELPAQEQPVGRTTSPATNKTDLWEVVEDTGVTSRLVVANAKGGLNIYGGTVATTVKEGPGGKLEATTLVDAPGSFWIIAKGGANWKGTVLAAGRIYHVENNGELRLASAEISVRVESKNSRSVYGSPADTEQPVATLEAGEAVELLLPAENQTGAHKIRLLKEPQAEGYIRGPWDTLRFYKQRTIVNAAAPAEGSLHELILGKWFGNCASRKTSGQLEEWDEMYEFEPNGTCKRILTLDGMSARIASTYQIQDDHTLVTQPEGVDEKTVWKMTISKDSLVLAHSTNPEPGAVGKGTSKLSRDYNRKVNSSDGVRESSAQRAGVAKFGNPPAKWPKIRGVLNGAMRVTVKNPNDFQARVGLRSGERGLDFIVPANDSRSVSVPNGRYEIYFQYSNDPESLYQGDRFGVNNNQIEIQIRKAIDGNFGIRKIN